MNVAFVNAWGLVFKGGPMMWPILILSVFALAIAVEKLLALQNLERRMVDVKVRILNAIRENRLKEALQMCEEQPTVISRVLKAGILKFGTSAQTMKGAMEEIAYFEIHQIKQRMGLLAMIVNAAPLLGLLGTISGMCVVFHAVQMRSNALNPLSLGDMSSGIWQALLTTVAGLMVGVMALAVHGFCGNRINDFIVLIEQIILEASQVLHNISESGMREEQSQHES